MKVKSAQWQVVYEFETRNGKPSGMIGADGLALGGREISYSIKTSTRRSLLVAADFMSANVNQVRDHKGRGYRVGWLFKQSQPKVELSISNSSMVVVRERNST